jgi:isocitrate dehydrogenase (NAD+)
VVLRGEAEGFGPVKQMPRGHDNKDGKSKGGFWMAEVRTHKITLVPGDGIGPEVAAVMVEVLEAAGKKTGCKFEWHTFEAGADAYAKNGELIPPALYESIAKDKVAIKGPTATPIGGGFSSINVAMRKKFDLYANVRPVKSLPGLETKYPGIDLVIFRENTEDLYAGLEVMISPDIAQSMKIITRKGSTRIAVAAFEYAKKLGRKKVHSIHKANIMKMSDGLFIKCTKEVSEKYPDIQYIEHIVDNTCMQLVMNPYQYDVILTENLYGDILSDLCSGLIGGLGLVPGANIGADCAIFEAVHGSAPDIAGQDKANPTALLQSAVMMLDYLGEAGAAKMVQAAIEKVYAEGMSLTRDVGGSVGTKAFGAAVLAAL